MRRLRRGARQRDHGRQLHERRARRQARRAPGAGRVERARRRARRRRDVVAPAERDVRPPPGAAHGLVHAEELAELAQRPEPRRLGDGIRAQGRAELGGHGAAHAVDAGRLHRARRTASQRVDAVRAHHCRCGVQIIAGAAPHRAWRARISSRSKGNDGLLTMICQNYSASGGHALAVFPRNLSKSGPRSAAWRSPRFASMTGRGQSHQRSSRSFAIVSSSKR